MQTVKSLEGKRWFIWTIVISVVALVGLATYIVYVSNVDSADASGTFLVHHAKKVNPAMNHQTMIPAAQSDTTDNTNVENMHSQN